MKRMKRIACNFYRPESVHIDEYDNIVGKMEYDLKTICTEPVDELSLYYYVNKLVRVADTLDRCPGMYFLGLAEPGSMPSDARCLYFYRPTYIGASIIMKAVMLQPEFLDDKAEFDWEHADECRETVRKVLPGLLLGCTGRGFQGHGFDALEGMIETLDIFAGAGTDAFLEKYPDLCPKFTELYHSSMQNLEKMLEDGKVQNEWGEDYTESVRVLISKKG